ncbi:MAG: hypothetical protein ACOX24_01275 [Christensenellales bacterium]|jgi:hypothetical protein
MRNHNFSFDGGEILSRISAAFFVSYAYYEKIDSSHIAWKEAPYTENSRNSRLSKYRNSRHYHEGWLHEVMKMEQLDRVPNKCGLNSYQIKDMAFQLLNKK